MLGASEEAYGQKVFNSTVGVVECSAHGAIDISAGETHSLHLHNGAFSGGAHGQGRGVTKCGA